MNSARIVLLLALSGLIIGCSTEVKTFPSGPIATQQTPNGLPAFEAELKVTVTFLPCDQITGICSNTATGIGYATGLGRVTLTAATSRHGSLNPCAPLTGTRTFISDAGSIFLTVSGEGCANSGGVVSANLVWTVTGGTGAYSNASGTGSEFAKIVSNAFSDHYAGFLAF